MYTVSCIIKLVNKTYYNYRERYDFHSLFEPIMHVYL